MTGTEAYMALLAIAEASPVFKPEPEGATKDDTIVTNENLKAIPSDDGGFPPARLPDTRRRLLSELDNWPRRVGSRLFIVKDGEICWLDDPPKLFAWYGNRGIVRWRAGSIYTPKGEFFEDLRCNARAYDGIEVLPHVPKVARRFYIAEDLPAGDGKALANLLSRFCPQRSEDRDLIVAYFATPLWGGRPGARPAFTITSPHVGRGGGKTSAMQANSRLYGGAIDVSANEDIAVIKQRLLTPESEHKRIVALDNVKSGKFSWSELEALITADTISGKRLYAGEASRENFFTFIVTMNAPGMSVDLVQRSVEIQLGKPAYSPEWRDGLFHFIEDNRILILADLATLLRQPPASGDVAASRWGEWEAGVLRRCAADPDACMKIIADRRGHADVEAEEAEIIETYFHDRLRSLGYDPNSNDIFIPTGIVCQWYNSAMHDHKKSVGVTRIMRQMHDEGRLDHLVPARSGPSGARGFRYVGPACDLSATTEYDLPKRIAKEISRKEREARESREVF